MSIHPALPSPPFPKPSPPKINPFVALPSVVVPPVQRVIEYQKKYIPHAHIIIRLDTLDTTPDVVNRTTPSVRSSHTLIATVDCLDADSAIFTNLKKFSDT